MQVDGSSPLDRLVLGCFSHPEVARTGSELAAWRRDQPGPRVQRCVWGGVANLSLVHNHFGFKR